MKYNGATVKQNGNDILVTSAFGNFIEHAPISTVNGSSIGSSFSIKNNAVSFKTEKYDKTQPLKIDPWTTSTTFTTTNAVYDIDYDNYGNVYAAGGGSTTEYQIVKYNLLGVLQWTYTATFTYIYSGSYYLYSDLALDRRSGTCYFAEGGDIPTGCQVLKVNSAGTQMGILTASSTIQEMWRLAFDYCNNQIIIGGGNPNGAPNPAQAATLDTALTTIKAINVLGAVDYYHDIALMALDGYGNAYMASSKNIANTNYNNTIIKLSLPSLSPTAYSVYDGHSFNELASSRILSLLKLRFYLCRKRI